MILNNKRNKFIINFLFFISYSCTSHCSQIKDLSKDYSIVEFVQDEIEKGNIANMLAFLDALEDQYIPEALYTKGILTLNGYYSNGIRNPREATSYFSKAAAKGYVPAYTALADSFLSGDGAVKNEKGAFALYKQAADLGDGVAQFNVAILYRDGIGVEKSIKKSLFYSKKASQNKTLKELQENARIIHKNLLKQK
jgi:TPR repeat protein